MYLHMYVCKFIVHIHMYTYICVCSNWYRHIDLIFELRGEKQLTLTKLQHISAKRCGAQKRSVQCTRSHPSVQLDVTDNDGNDNH